MLYAHDLILLLTVILGNTSICGNDPAIYLAYISPLLPSTIHFLCHSGNLSLKSEVLITCFLATTSWSPTPSILWPGQNQHANVFCFHTVHFCSHFSHFLAITQLPILWHFPTLDWCIHLYSLICAVDYHWINQWQGVHGTVSSLYFCF